MSESRVLVLNSGSSSLKASLYRFPGRDVPADPFAPLWKTHVSAGQRIEPLLQSLPAKPDMVGHRVVHGGSSLRQPMLITPEVKRAIREAGALAPVHSEFEIAAMGAVERVLGSATPQVAVFDTAFHGTLPPVAYTYPGPYSWSGEGIRRYGFHGISHEYAATRTARLLGRDLASLRIITCHLGNGCSLAAIRNGVCVDTTMGFTPLEGLMMGTRSGSIDPGVVLHLLRRGSSVDKVEHLLNHQSGLLGISGVSSDMREILAAMERGEARARLAFDLYVYRVRLHIGALLPVLGGLDALVFTAGVGENSPAVRREICRDMDFISLAIDELANKSLQEEGDFSAPASKVSLLVVKAQEEWQIAVKCLQLGITR